VGLGLSFIAFDCVEFGGQRAGHATPDVLSNDAAVLSP
jgi:hypothetical protein